MYVHTFILTDTSLHDVAKGREAHQSSTGLPKLHKNIGCCCKFHAPVHKKSLQLFTILQELLQDQKILLCTNKPGRTPPLP